MLGEGTNGQQHPFSMGQPEGAIATKFDKKTSWSAWSAVSRSNAGLQNATTVAVGERMMGFG